MRVVLLIGFSSYVHESDLQFSCSVMESKMDVLLPVYKVTEAFFRLSKLFLWEGV